MENIINQLDIFYKQHGKKKVVNFTELKLAYNFYKKTKPNIDYITGPSSVTRLSDGDKDIYIFSDFHYNRKPKCNYYKNYTCIYQYLDKLFKSTDVFIDFFIETYKYLDKKQIYEKYKYEDCHLTNADLFFANCLNPIKWINCYDNIVRAHTIDIRKIDDVKNEYAGILQDWGYMDDHLDEYNELCIEKILYFKKFIKDVLMDININDIFTNYTNTHVKKELKRSYRSEEILEYMIEFVNKKKNPNLNIIEKDAKKLYELILEYDDIVRGNQYKIKLETRMFNLYKKIGENLFDIHSRFMDIYTLSRIFKKFKNTGSMPVEPKNIIIYQGEQHSIACIYVLKKMGFEIIEESVNNADDLCVKMKNIEQPFFSKE